MYCDIKKDEHAKVASIPSPRESPGMEMSDNYYVNRFG